MEDQDTKAALQAYMEGLKEYNQSNVNITPNQSYYTPSVAYYPNWPYRFSGGCPNCGYCPYCRRGGY